MKERPINMRADEVRAILAWRKTQFRDIRRRQAENDTPELPMQ